MREIIRRRVRRVRGRIERQEESKGELRESIGEFRGSKEIIRVAGAGK